MINSDNSHWPYINNGDIIITNGGYILPTIVRAPVQGDSWVVGNCSLTKYFKPYDSYGIGVRICENWGLVSDDTKIAYDIWTNTMPRSEFIEFINGLLW